MRSPPLRTCPRGHAFTKSSDCPTCPFCELEKVKASGGFLAKLGAPAYRALKHAGLLTLKKLSKHSEKEILKLHGMGPGSLPVLRAALKEEGLAFRAEDKTPSPTGKKKAVKPPSDLPTLAFADAAEFEKWIARHRGLDGVWIKIAKKDSGVSSITIDEALDVALCHGWIDGQRNGLDEKFYLQKYTPRRPRSLWSKRNIAKVAALTAAGRMRPAGLAQVEAAQKDGRWDAAYGSSREMVVPDDFLKAVKKSRKAKASFDTLNAAQRFSISFRLHTAKKPETRARRLDALMAMLEAGIFK
jgi:uncharacterized protein YdeI (YjbR/CyaY-like superfamily)